MSEERSVRMLRWQPHFRHSAGSLGSQFIRAVREGRLVGWKTRSLGVTVPPIASGEPGEWVGVGPGATLVAHAPSDDFDSMASARTVVAIVKIDGADTVTPVLVEGDDDADLHPGTALMVKFDASAAASILPVFRVARRP